MSKTRRKIIALGTALSLAFVLVAALLPMKDVKASTDAYSVTLNGPAAETTITAEDFYGVTIYKDMVEKFSSTVNSGNVKVNSVYAVKRLPNPGETEDDIMFTPNVGDTITYNAGETYYFMVEIAPTGENFPDDAASLTQTIKGVSDWKQLNYDPSQSTIVVALKIASGGNTDPSSDPTDNSGNSSSTDATPASSSADNSSDATTASNTATTTKATAPKTGDVMPFVPVVLVLAGATAIGVIAIRRKNS